MYMGCTSYVSISSGSCTAQVHREEILDRPKKKAGRPKRTISAEIVARYLAGEECPEALAAEAKVSLYTLKRHCRDYEEARGRYLFRRILNSNYQVLKAGSVLDVLEMNRKIAANILARMEATLMNPDQRLNPKELLALADLNSRFAEEELARRDLEEAERAPKQVGSGDAGPSPCLVAAVVTTCEPAGALEAQPPPGPGEGVPGVVSAVQLDPVRPAVGEVGRDGLEDPHRGMEPAGPSHRVGSADLPTDPHRVAVPPQEDAQMDEGSVRVEQDREDDHLPE